MPLLSVVRRVVTRIPVTVTEHPPILPSNIRNEGTSSLGGRTTSMVDRGRGQGVGRGRGEGRGERHSEVRGQPSKRSIAPFVGDRPDDRPDTIDGINDRNGSRPTKQLRTSANGRLHIRTPVQSGAETDQTGQSTDHGNGGEVAGDSDYTPS